MWQAVRIVQHQAGEYGAFTSHYQAFRLVYFECYYWPKRAIARDKPLKGLKGWRHAKKIALIERDGPTWEDPAEK